jgi:nitrite reductase/ring-hydroxylating ferredoxin subunit
VTERDSEFEQHTVAPDRRRMSEQPKWRLDFPIDAAQEIYVARRDFGKFLGLTSLGFVVGQFWIALQNGWRQARGNPPLSRITTLDELPVGSAISFNYPTSSDPALLLRPAADRLLAYSAECTHLQCPVLPMVEAGKLRCPCHAGYFDLQTGRPLAGPPRRSLRRIEVRLVKSDIYAAGFLEETV